MNCSKKSGRGAFICFEGIDHSGKSTQARLVAEKLGSEVGSASVRVMTFPDRSSPTGVLINGYLTDKSKTLEDHVVHLLYAANRWEKMGEIEKLLEEGVTVIADRYTYSGIAYTLAKDRVSKKDNPVFSYEWCIACERGLLRPDKVIFFDIDVKTALERGNAGGKSQERYETSPFLSAVKSVYDEELVDKSFWHIIDAHAKPEEITSQVMDVVHQVIEDVKTKSTQRIA